MEQNLYKNLFINQFSVLRDKSSITVSVGKDKCHSRDFPYTHKIQRGETLCKELLEGKILENNNTGNSGCSFREGELMCCAPLAMTYTPMQQSSEPAYEADQALVRGTLFPGLDLPFMNSVNKGSFAGTPLGELMALDFVIKELNLYLDNHKNDIEAFETLQATIALYKEGRAQYVRLYGPLMVTDMDVADSYTWICDPWPWDYCDETEE